MPFSRAYAIVQLSTLYTSGNWTFGIDSNGTSVTVNITQSPVVHFTTDPGVNATTVDIKGHVSISQNVLSASMDFEATAAFGIELNSTGTCGIASKCCSVWDLNATQHIW